MDNVMVVCNIAQEVNATKKTALELKKFIDDVIAVLYSNAKEDIFDIIKNNASGEKDIYQFILEVKKINE